MHMTSTCTSKRSDTIVLVDIKEDVKVAVARANITEVIARVRLLRWTVFLINRQTPMAAVVPIELGRLIRRAGGADVAAGILADHLGIGMDEVRDNKPTDD